MTSWWQRLKRKLGSPGSEPRREPGLESEERADAPRERALWLAADANRFGMPVLDLISITGQLLSVTTDPSVAARAVSWGRSSGAELDLTPLNGVAPLTCSLRYPAEPLLGDGLLFTPQEMEHKWVIALRGQLLIAARSWTGEVAAIADVRREGHELVVERVRLREGLGLAELGDPLQIFDWLIRSHALGQSWPLPVDEQGAATLEHTPLIAMSSFGYMAKCAARSWDPPAPDRPLRSDGPLMQALRAGERECVRELLAAGAPVDAPSPTLGLRPLAVAVIQKDIELIDLLVSAGADPNLGDERGLVPLGRAVVHGGDIALLERLVAAGARTDAINHDGFGLLHAVAETNRAELVGWMLDHGVALEGRTRHDHTPLHIASALGHVEAARALLDAGADRSATSKGQDALAIARERNQPAIVELLQQGA